MGHFAPPGGPLDREARKRGTSVYLPQRVIPMFPEVISNGLASLQEGKVRYVKTVGSSSPTAGEPVSARFANGAIRNRKRFTYEQVQAILDAPARGGGEGRRPGDRRGCSWTCGRCRKAMRDRRAAPRVARTVDARGGAGVRRPGPRQRGPLRRARLSHQIIEEFMLAANEAVAEHFDRLEVPFLRRVHPAPDPRKLEAFAQFARTLGYKMPRRPSRFDLQRVLNESAETTERHAVHYALLRSLKQAIYSPEQDEHYALASEQLLPLHLADPPLPGPDRPPPARPVAGQGQGPGGREGAARLGDHCSKMERRAETAEREVVKLRLLSYLSDRLGLELDAVITGVADYGFFAQGKEFPAEGLVHISSLADDYYHFDDDGHLLEGRRHGQRYRLGDQVRVEVVRVDLQRRQLDFRVGRQRCGPDADSDAD